MKSKSEHMEAIASKLTMLGLLYPRVDFPPAAQAAYAAMLADYDIDSIGPALKLAVKENKFLPSVAEIIAALERINPIYKVMTHEEALGWAANTEKGLLASPDTLRPDELAAKRAYSIAGVATHFEEGLIADRKWVLKDFARIYARLVDGLKLTAATAVPSTWIEAGTGQERLSDKQADIQKLISGVGI